MKLYEYLYSVKQKQSCYPDEVTLYEEFCIWVLRNVFAKQYCTEVAIRQTTFLKRENARYAKKLNKALELYAAHIGEPAYSMLWCTLEMGEEKNVAVSFPVPNYTDLSDAEFMQQKKIMEVV